MRIAEETAKLSSAVRLQVGSIIVKNGATFIGYNGTPSGWDNCCEDKVWDSGAGGWLDPTEFDAKYPYEEWHEGAQRIVRYGLKTKPEVLHAESNALTKIAKSTESSEGAVLFCTHAPCLECAKLIGQSGIKEVYFKNYYRSTAGLEHLAKCNVIVTKYDNAV